MTLTMSWSLLPLISQRTALKVRNPLALQRLNALRSAVPRRGVQTKAFLDSSKDSKPGQDKVRTGLKAESGPSESQFSSLTVGEIKSILDDARIYHRDCFERGELLQRLQDNMNNLQQNGRSRLEYMLRRHKEGDDMSASQPLAPTHLLFMDEQYVVSLFQAAKKSVVNVTSLVDARGVPLGLNPLQVPQGTGSGFLWDSAGHVVTNWHVVMNAKVAKVTLWNNKTYDAILRGVEPDKDLALLKIVSPTDEPLKPVTVGSSGGLQVGQRVFAIGNPFGLDQTLTGGLVSAVGREIRGITGNSGGPLLDSRGRLIGVNTMIYSPSGVSSGIGFAIPSDTVRRVVSQLVRHGRVVRPGLGVICLPDTVMANTLPLEQRGVIIKDVVPGSGAAQAGLRGTRASWGKVLLGDIITAVGAQKIITVEDLVSAIEQFSLHDLVPLTIRRDGQILNLQVPLLNEQQAAKPY